MATEKETPVTRSWLTKLLGGVAERINTRFDGNEAKILKLIERVAELEGRVESFSHSAHNDGAP